jgi:sugar lactone lactonase YvrE
MRKILVSTLLVAGVLSAQPEISFDSNTAFLKPPATINFGEVAGVATDSKGNVFVYDRTGEQLTMGASRFFSHGGSRLLMFDPTGKFVREIGQGIYGALFAQGVRVDAQDNIWAVDRGSNVVMKFDNTGKFLQVLGRKPESINPAPPPATGGGRGGGRGPIQGDNFNRPTDIAWDQAGNMFVSDGYNNSRIVKLDKTGRFIKAWGQRGSEKGQFNMPNSIAVDAKGDVYVADMGNKRIQVFDNNGTYKTEIAGVGSPMTICISPGAHQFLYASNSNPPDTLDNGEIYKLELDGKVVGKFGRAGKLAKEFGTVNAIDCRNPNSLLVGEVQNWRVQKVTLKP